MHPGHSVDREDKNAEQWPRNQARTSSWPSTWKDDEWVGGWYHDDQHGWHKWWTKKIPEKVEEPPVPMHSGSMGATYQESPNKPGELNLKVLAHLYEEMGCDTAPSPGEEDVVVPPFSEPMREALLQLPPEAAIIYMVKKTGFWTNQNESDVDMDGNNWMEGESPMPDAVLIYDVMNIHG